MYESCIHVVHAIDSYGKLHSIAHIFVYAIDSYGKFNHEKFSEWKSISEQIILSILNL